jgi:signal transduction histidine kinase
MRLRRQTTRVAIWLEAGVRGRAWLIVGARVARWLEVGDEGLPVEEQRLLRRHQHLVWETALALYAAGLVLGFVIDPPRDALLRWGVARLVTLLLLVLTVAVVSRLVFAQRIARLRELTAGDAETELFVKSVTHDLRSPLTTIKAYAQMLQRQPATSQAALGVKGLQRIEGAVSRAAAMLDELSDVPQVRAGRPLELRYERLDLLALVREVLGEYEQITADHALRLETRLASLPGEWDRARMARVLGNLLSNAVKYSPAGGSIVVTVAVAEKAGEQCAVVSVCDEGVGISDADIGHVFEPFYRGSHASGPIEGSGIGLASARWIVEQHGGSMSVESKPDVGSTFTVRVPVLPEPHPGSPPVDSAVPEPTAQPPVPVRPARLARPALFGLAAAALVLVLGSGGLFVRLQAESSSRRQIEELLAHAVAQPLQAADSARGGGGRVYLDPARDQVLVVASDLPPLPSDRAYQLWFVRPDGQRDSGGLLMMDARGDGTLLAHAPAGLAAYNAIGITEEPASGSEQPTGLKVVGATLAGSS